MSAVRMPLAQKSHRPRRPIRYLLVGVLLLITVPIGFILLMQHVAALRIRDAEAEADQLDPGWRLEDLEAARAEIPNAENSALVVIETARLMPPNWINWTLPPPQGVELLRLCRKPPNLALKTKQREEAAN